MNKRQMSSWSLSNVLIACCVLSVAWGCGGDFSPTAPQIQQPTSGATFGSESASVISGQLVSGGGSVAGASAFGGGGAASPAAVAQVQVSVQGTNITTLTDDDGGFQLINVPTGNIMLQITGTGTNATVLVQGVGANQNLTITIQVQPNSAQIVSTEVEDLDEFEGTVVDVDDALHTFTLDDGTVLLTNEHTWWDRRSDLLSFEELLLAFGTDVTINVEGRSVLLDSGELFATVVSAEIDDDVASFELAIIPDHWDVGWATSGGSDTNGSVKARIEGGPFADIDPTSVLMEGPDGAPLSPVETKVDSHRFEARFLKSAVIAIVASIPVGGTTPITVRGLLTDGVTEFELTATITVVDDDDDDEADDDNGDDDGPDAAAIAQAIQDVHDLIDDIHDLVDDGDLASNNASSLISKLENVIDKLDKGNVTPAINELKAFINEVEADIKTGKLSEHDGEDLIEAAKDIIKHLGGGGEDDDN